MKKLFALLFITTLFAQNSDFRKVNFGDNLEKIKNTETMEFLMGDDNPEIPNGYQSMYEGKVGGIDTYLLYNFYNDSLYQAAYMFIKEHKSNRNGFISDYNNIKKILEKKYGKGTYPNGKEYYWSNDLYQDAYEDWGMALAIGHLRVVIEYNYIANNGNNIQIRHALTGANYKVSHGMVYTDSELDKIASSAEEESSLDDF
jgi:hypothetical protein